VKVTPILWLTGCKDNKKLGVRSEELGVFYIFSFFSCAEANFSLFTFHFSLLFCTFAARKDQGCDVNINSTLGFAALYL
jgi:hypothetical protein